MRIKDDNEIKNILKIISPGTNLREGLENILRAVKNNGFFND